MNDFVIGLILIIVPAAGFVAYNHPEEYRKWYSFFFKSSIIFILLFTFFITAGDYFIKLGSEGVDSMIIDQINQNAARNLVGYIAFPMRVVFWGNLIGSFLYFLVTKLKDQGKKPKGSGSIDHAEN